MNIAYNPGLQHGQLASVGQDKTIRLWQVPTSQNELPQPMPETKIHSQYLAYAADMQQLISANTDNSISLQDVSTKKIVNTLDAKIAATCLVYDPSRDELAASMQAIIHLLNIKEGQITKTLAGHTQAVTCLAYHPLGYQLASGSKDKTVRLWDLVNEKSIILKGHTRTIKCLAYHPSGQLLASGSNNIIYLWKAQENSLPEQLQSSLNRIQALAFHPSEPELVAGNENGDICLWNMSTRQEHRLIARSALETHQVKIIYVGYIPRSNYLLSCDAKGKIILWNRAIKTAVAHYQLSPAKQLIYTDNFLITLSPEGIISYWKTLYGLNPSHPYLPGWRLHWVSHLTTLNVTNMRIQSATGLAPSAMRLFQQRGTQGLD